MPDFAIGEQGHGWVRAAIDDPGLRNTHGWSEPTTMRTNQGPCVVQFGDAIEERRRCSCDRDMCNRAATQEDFRCDECRETCR